MFGFLKRLFGYTPMKYSIVAIGNGSGEGNWYQSLTVKSNGHYMFSSSGREPRLVSSDPKYIKTLFHNLREDGCWITVRYEDGEQKTLSGPKNVTKMLSQPDLIISEFTDIGR